MSLIHQLLGLDWDDITISSLTKYFQEPRIESDLLEYKSYAIVNQNNHQLKERGILKTICAMVNSEGGVIIWGSPVERRNSTTGAREFAGDLSPIDRRFEHDNFLSRVYQSIYPMPKDIKLKIIPVRDNECICVFEIKKTTNTIHRYDDRYWIRLDGQTHVAPHHYVEAMMKQVSYPNIEAYVKISEYAEERWIKGGTNQVFKYGDIILRLGIQISIFNWSGLLNEEDVSFNITSRKGIFLDYLIEQTESDHDGKFYTSRQYPLLWYGEPIFEMYYLAIDPAELGGNLTFDFSLALGGKRSPRKRSEYKIHLDRISSTNPGAALEVVVENQLLVDMHTELEITKEVLLKNIIGR